MQALAATCDKDVSFIHSLKRHASLQPLQRLHASLNTQQQQQLFVVSMN